MNYPFPNFDKLSPEDQARIKGFDEDPSVMVMQTSKGAVVVETAAQFVELLTEAGILKPL